MTIQELISLSKTRINYLNVLRTSAVASGDVTQLTIIDNELSQTQETLNYLLQIQTNIV
jgi:hypothetical protein